MFKKKLSLLLLILPTLFFYKNSLSIEPSIFVQSTVNRASQVLSTDIEKKEKMLKLQEIAKDTVDIKGIGMYTLGKYRKEINDNQKEKYNELFEKYFLKSFSSRLSEYSNPKIDVQSEEKINEKYTIVTSLLQATDKRPEVKIDWRIYTKNPDKPLIRDLIIEGLSLARTQKEEFNSVIQSANGDINALFINLETFISK